MLVYCKECEHQCSDKADVCPGCGNPLRARVAPPPQKVIVKHKQGTSLFNIFILLVLVLLCFPCFMSCVGLPFLFVV